MNNTPELALPKPCAHCGGMAIITKEDYSNIYVECNRCWVRTAGYIHSDYALEAWNKRV